MTAAITGGCLCGGVRFSYDGAAGPASYCHCVDCRRATGGPFAVSVRLDAARLTVTGATASHTKASDAGSPITRHFCPACGSPLFTHTAGAPTAYVKAGAFDDPALVRPALEIWTQSRVPWAQVPEGLEHHPRDRNG
ncbi:MAG: GFA family protein [Proteobacteria bacterium]|nr:GFA family protein [Pseudomonadota bacterium]MDA1070010.1 GFA family protein [Pseudomonadota bacterium]